MSTLLTLSIVALMLGIMVSLAVTLQSIEKKKQERKRLESSLRAKQRSFQQLLHGFPEGFLPKELRALVAQCIVEVNEQLADLLPSNQQAQNDRLRAQQDYDEIRKEPSTNGNKRLQNTNEIKEVQALLKTLSLFLKGLQEKRRVSAKNAQVYHQQIQQLGLQTTIDTLDAAIIKANASNKTKLARHYIQMALDRMQKENSGGVFNDRISEYQAQAKVLDEELEAAATRQKAAAAELAEAEKADESWKKKAIYD